MRPSLAWMIRAVSAFLVALAIFAAAQTARADSPTEKEVQELQRKAVQEDFLNVDYPSAIQKLKSALGRCGADRCGAPVRAAVLRDLGAMQILAGGVEEGRANFALAVAADSSLELDPGVQERLPRRGVENGKGGGERLRLGRREQQLRGPGAHRGGAAAGSPPGAGDKHTVAREQATKTPGPVDALAGAECPPDFPGCNSKKQGGVDCNKDRECQSNACVGGKCENKKGGGDDCESDPECASGSCSAGKCSAAQKAIGEECEVNDECDSGSCKEGKCQGGGPARGVPPGVGRRRARARYRAGARPG